MTHVVHPSLDMSLNIGFFLKRLLWLVFVMIGFFMVGLFVQEAVSNWNESPVITYFGDQALPVIDIQVFILVGSKHCLAQKIIFPVYHDKSHVFNYCLSTPP